jgi:excisionase family DNA binding protein
MERYLFSQGAATLLGVSLSTIYKYSESGRLPHTKVMGKLRFDREILIEILSGKRKLD